MWKKIEELHGFEKDFNYKDPQRFKDYSSVLFYNSRWINENNHFGIISGEDYISKSIKPTHFIFLKDLPKPE